MVLAIDKLVNGDIVYVASNLTGEVVTSKLIVEGPVLEGHHVIQIKTSGPTINLKVKAPNGDIKYYKGMKIFSDNNEHRFFFTDINDTERLEFLLMHMLSEESDGSVNISTKSDIRKKLSIEDFKQE